MAIRDDIRGVLMEAAGRVFGMSAEEAAKHADENLVRELGATSQQYFPIIAALEEELDIELQYQDFRREARTLNEAVDFVADVYKRTYGE